jgi:uncharacterized membrane protein YgcG
MQEPFNNDTSILTTTTCTESCWTSSPTTPCLLQTFSDGTVEEICSCQTEFMIHDMSYLHQIHTCELPSWWFIFLYWFYLFLGMINFYRILQAWKRLLPNPQVRIILLTLLQHLFCFSAATLAIWIQNGFYEAAPLLLFLGRTLGTRSTLLVSDALFLPIPLPHARKEKLRIIRQRIWLLFSFIQVLFAIVVVVLCRMPKYRNEYNWTLLAMLFVARTTGIALLIMLRKQIQTILELLPLGNENLIPGNTTTNNTDNNIWVAKHALKKLEKQSLQFFISSWIPFPWIISYWITGVAPYFFVMFSFDLCAIGINLTNTVIGFCDLLSVNNSNNNTSNGGSNNNNNVHGSDNGGGGGGVQRTGGGGVEENFNHGNQPTLQPVIVHYQNENRNHIEHNNNAVKDCVVTSSNIVGNTIHKFYNHSGDHLLNNFSSSSTTTPPTITNKLYSSKNSFGGGTIKVTDGIELPIRNNDRNSNNNNNDGNHDGNHDGGMTLI